MKMKLNEQVNALMAGLDSWKLEKATIIRNLIASNFPELTENFKWNTPVYSGKSNVVAFSIFKDHLKINFFQGARLSENAGIFNAGLDASKTRGIDLFENDEVNVEQVRAAIVEAIKVDAN